MAWGERRSWGRPMASVDRQVERHLHGSYWVIVGRKRGWRWVESRRQVVDWGVCSDVQVKQVHSLGRQHASEAQLVSQELHAFDLHRCCPPPYEVLVPTVL